jgi:transposase-like protein
MRTYSADEKATALNLYVSHGLAEAWRLTGIPKPTIATWAKAAGLRTFDTQKTEAATEAHVAHADELRARLRVQLLEKASDLLDRMDAMHVDFKGKDADAVTYPIAPASAVQNYATSVGILIDKYRLEVGEATTRSESRALTEDMDDHERRALRDAIDAELARRVAAGGEG